MSKSMKKFKKSAVLAMTIPTLLGYSSVSFAMKSPRPPKQHDYELKRQQNAKLKREQIARDGLGGFQESRNFEKKIFTKFTRKPSSEIFNKLRENYGEKNAYVITNLNYIRSCICVLTSSDENTISTIMSTLNTTLGNNKDAWASIKYVVDEIYKGVNSNGITQNKVFASNKYLHEFFYRGAISYKRNFNIALIQTLQQKLSSDEYADKSVGGNDSFGKTVLENAIEVCTKHEDGYNYSNEFTSRPENIYSTEPTKQQSAFLPASSDSYEVISSSQSREENSDTSSKPIKPTAADKEEKNAKTKKRCKHTDNPKCPEYDQVLYGSSHRYKCRNEKCKYCNDKQILKLYPNGKLVAVELRKRINYEEVNCPFCTDGCKGQFRRRGKTADGKEVYYCHIKGHGLFINGYEKTPAKDKIIKCPSCKDEEGYAQMLYAKKLASMDNLEDFTGKGLFSHEKDDNGNEIFYPIYECTKCGYRFPQPVKKQAETETQPN